MSLKSKFKKLISNLKTPNRQINCNFCGTIFNTKTLNHSEFLSCSYCQAIARDRVVYQTILEEFGTESNIIKDSPALKDLKVLEFSPVNNKNRREIYENTFAKYVGSDFDLSAYSSDVRIDLTKDEDVKKYENSFDVIIFAHVLEHIPEYKTAIKNLKKLLTPNGIAILQVPFLEKEYTKVTWEEYHGDHTKVFHRFGFDIVEDLKNEFSDYKILFGMLDYEILSPEIKKEKYDVIREKKYNYSEFGATKVSQYGLGCYELCDAILLRK